MTITAIIGAGGFGRECLRIVRDQTGNGNRIVFVEEQPRNRNVHGHDVLSLDEFCNLDTHREFNIAIANSAARERIAGQAEAAGAHPVAFIAKTAIVGDGVSFSAGAILHDNTRLTADCHIGRYFHCNYYSYVPHDCQIGNFVTFGPGVRLGGNVIVEDHAYIGAGAMIRQGTAENPVRIGYGATIGMGAVVLHDVPEGATVAGVPARTIR